jgi:hypothetical protein
MKKPTDAKNVNVFVKRDAKTETFKRPNHPDFWDSSECKKNRFTGVRKNDMALQWEFWILGNMEKTVTYNEVALNPKALANAHVELFKMRPDPALFERK